MKKILFISAIFLVPLPVFADGCELFGKEKPVGTEILVTDEKGVSYEMLCAEVVELHYVDGKVKIKSSEKHWAKKITNDFGEDCW